MSEALDTDHQVDLPARWRAPFETSFGVSFAQVAILAGPRTNRYLARCGALAMATDHQTICVTTQLLKAPLDVLVPVLGHELAHTVQLAGGGEDSVDYLEAEAWAASRAALNGQRQVIKGSGRQPLAAAGLYMGDAAKEFMETFGIAPLQVPRGNTAKIDPLTFDKMLDLMTVTFKDEEDFAIDAHGEPNGFGIEIVQGEKASATLQSLSTLPQILKLREELNKAGDDLKALQQLVRDTFHDIPDSPGDPNNPDAVARSVGVNKKRIETEISRLKTVAKFQDETKMKQVVKKIADLKNKQRNRIELRTCNMGHFPPIMDFFRKMFNAKILRAATNFSAFGHFIPDAPRSETTYNAFIKQHGKAFPYPVKAGGKFAFEYQALPGAKANIPSAGTSDAAVDGWIKEFLGSAPNVKVAKFPTHFLLTDPPAFPKQDKYKDHIKESKDTPPPTP